MSWDIKTMSNELNAQPEGTFFMTTTLSFDRERKTTAIWVKKSDGLWYGFTPGGYTMHGNGPLTMATGFWDEQWCLS